MEMILQIWGGSAYLMNKILFSLAEGRNRDARRMLKLWGWGIYILGVPAWVIILLGQNNWIASSIEAGGIPSMLLGFYLVYKGRNHPPVLFDRIASAFTYGSIVLGIGYSLYDYGGIRSLSQILETGVTIGFLLGSYLLAKNNRKGWLFFMLMNGSMASLMFIQHKPVLALQQIASISFVLYGYFASAKEEKCFLEIPRKIIDN